MKKKDEVISIEEQIRNQVMPIFNKVLKEKNKNTMVDVTTIKFLWRPHNYRLKMPFFKDRRCLRNWNNLRRSEHYPPKLTKSGFPMESSLKNYNTKLIVRIAQRITLIIDKETITGIYTLKYLGKNNRFWYLFEASNIDDVALRVKAKADEIESQVLEGIKEFTRIFGGRAHVEEKKWDRHEDEVKGEDFIDKIPKDMIINDTTFKKVYPTGIEFKSPIFLKNYIRNRSVEDVAPQIAEEINKIRDELVKNQKMFSDSLREYNESLNGYNKNLKLHTQVQLDQKDNLAKNNEIQLKQKETLNKMNVVLNKLSNTLKEKNKPFFVRWWKHFRKK